MSGALPRIPNVEVDVIRSNPQVVEVIGRLAAITVVALLALACSEASPASNAGTAATPALDLAPTVVAGGTDTGRLPDGRYFGQLLRVDLQSALFHFVPICVGETNPTLRALPKGEQVETMLRTGTPAQLYIYRPVRQGDVASGSFREVDVAQIAQVVQSDSASRWWLTVSRNAIQRVEQDGGLRPTSADDPCPR